MIKRWMIPHHGMNWPVSHLKFENSDLAWTWWKIDWSPTGMTDQYLTLNFKVKIRPVPDERWLTSLGSDWPVPYLQFES